MSTYSPIATQTLSANASSVTFNGVPQGYTDLVIIIKGQGTSNIAITTTFNNDTATNYSRAYFYADGSGQSSGRVQNESGILFSFNAARGHTIMHINGYSNYVGFKNALISNDYYDNAVVRTSGVWRNTAPITSIKFSGTDIASGTVISLYGLAGGQAGAKASGGVISTSGAYTIHTFLQTGGFTPNEALTVDYLVVAGGAGGGGGAGSGEGGGGGAGGLRSTVTATGGGGSLESALSLVSGVTYPVIVGAGGAGATGSAIPGFNGSNSTFASISSVGGGGGGSRNTEGYFGQVGGSGGGGGQRDNTTANYGLGIANQGYRGGNGMNNGSPSDAGGGGGGGAGGVGADAPSGSTGGAGGSSINVSITGSSVAYAGGGGGSGSSTGGAAGGGGARPGNDSAPAGANTGGGGGGTASTGGVGGSGIVIVRYLT